MPRLQKLTIDVGVYVVTPSLNQGEKLPCEYIHRVLLRIE